MITYLILNTVVIIAVCLLLRIKVQRPARRTVIVAIALCLLTLIFDSALIYFHIIGYDGHHIVGLHVGLAPIEDYCYPILAAIIVPVLWMRFGKRRDGDN